MRVAFVHPDLGLGGAERLIIDAALSLQQRGHHCTIYTPYHDASRSFDDVHPDTACVPVVVVPVPLIPRTIRGRLHAILAAIRCLLVALYVVVRCPPDAAVVDLVSAPLLVFKCARIPVAFYCHFPDKLLANSLLTSPSSFSTSSPLKRLYRALIDAMEAVAMRAASIVVCNSQFTASMFGQVFPRLPTPSVVYPTVTMPDAPNSPPAEGSDIMQAEPSDYVLSLNRFETKKDIPLAVCAFHHYLKSRRPRYDPTLRDIPLQPQPRLVVAGGYDPRLPDNKRTLDQLLAEVQRLNLGSSVDIRTNVSDVERNQLLRHTRALLYTPRDEHFGIGPLEAMANRVPVIAVDSGGPRETVVHGTTGFLCQPTPDAFGDALARVLDDPHRAQRMGRAASERVQRHFLRETMGEQLDKLLTAIVT